MRGEESKMLVEAQRCGMEDKCVRQGVEGTGGVAGIWRRDVYDR
jgi:hypothetical protein